MLRQSIFFILVIILSGCKTETQTNSSKSSEGSISEAQAFYEDIEKIVKTYPHRAQLFRTQCENADDLLSYYHANGDKLDIPIVDFEYLDVFISKVKPTNSFNLSEWRGCRSKVMNRLYPKYKFLEEEKWGKTVSHWNELKKNKYIIICQSHKRMGPEILGNDKYNRAYYKGHFGIYNLASNEVECYGEFSVLNKYNRPEDLYDISPNLKKALWIDLSLMFDLKLKEAIERASGIPASNINLDLETL